MNALKKLIASLLFAMLSTSAFAITDAQVFAYAEANYSIIFTGTATAGQYLQYNYRHYPASGNYLAVDSSGMISILGTYTGGVLTPVGLVTAFANIITAWEATQGGAAPVAAAGTQMGGAIQGAPLNLTGAVSDLAGSGTQGALDGTGIAASFSRPEFITTDGTNLYVSDGGNKNIRKIVISTGVVTTLAGGGVGAVPSAVNCNGKCADGTGTAASFSSPAGITTDGTNLYVNDVDINKIRKIVIATGVVTTLAGGGGVGVVSSAANCYNKSLLSG